MRYVEPKPPRFQIVTVDGEPRLRVPARRNLLILLVLVLWLVLWAIGGAGAVASLFRRFDAFVAVWLVFWVLGFVAVGLTIAWQLAGAETLSVTAGDLHRRLTLAGWQRHRAYRGTEIAALRAVPQLWAAGPFHASQPLLPFARGSVQFRYGARTVHLVPGLDEAEAALVVEWLAQRLPAAEPRADG